VRNALPLSDGPSRQIQGVNEDMQHIAAFYAADDNDPRSQAFGVRPQPRPDVSKS
jgi:hypothetical protein